MRKIFRWFLISFLAVFVVLTAGGYYFSVHYEDEIKAYVIEKIEKQFSARIDVAKIELNLWQKFPYASLQFKDISITDTHIPENPPVLEAQNLFLQFNINDLLRQKIILRKVEIAEGQIDVVVYKGGKNNFQIGNESQTDSSGFFMSVENLRLRKMKILYENQSTVQMVQTYTNKINLPFELADSILNAGVNGNLILQSLHSDGVELFRNISLDLKTDLVINIQSGALKWEKSVLKANDLPLEINGEMIPENGKMRTNIQLSTNTSFANLLPFVNEYLPKNDFISGLSGNIALQISVDGSIGGQLQPAIRSSFSVSNAAMVWKEKEVELSQLNFSGNFSNGKRRLVESMSLTLNNLSGKLNGLDFAGKLSIKNFKMPILQTELATLMELDFLKRLLNLDIIEQAAGKVKVQFSYNDIFAKLSNINDLKNSRLALDFDIDSATIKLKGNNTIYSQISTSGRLSSQEISLDNLDFTASSMRIQAKGTIGNFWEALTENATLHIGLQATSAFIDLDQLLSFLTFDSGNSTVEPVSINAKIGFDVQKFRWNGMEASQVSGVFDYQENQWTINPLSLVFAEGNINGQIHAKVVNQGSRYLLKGNFDKVDISKSFLALNNFGQTIITEKNIFGKITGTVNLRFDADLESNILNNSIIGQTDFTIFDGRLKDVTQLNALSKYTRIDDFSDIRFSTLSNSITIENREILVPKMNIESDKMNMVLSGKHTFDNSYEYHINVLVSELLGKKRQKRDDEEFGVVVDDNTGKTRLFLTISGKGEDFQVRYDRKGVSEKLSQDIKSEGDELKKVLRDEFVNEQRDSLRRARKIEKEAERENLKRQENGEVLIRWEEESEDEYGGRGF